MDLDSLAARLAAARQMEAKVDGATFKLEVPSEHAWRVTYEEHRNTAGDLLYARASRAILDKALIGWDGVTAKHLLPDAPEEAIAFSPAARSMLLDARTDIADELKIALIDKANSAREAREAARKN